MTAPQQVQDLVHTVMRRVFPVLVSFTIITILVFSAVPPNLLFVQGRPAEILMGSYALMLLGLTTNSFDDVALHKVGSVLAVLTFGGRGGGFIELSIARETFDLVGAVAERVLLTFALVMWHARMGSTIAAKQETKRVMESQ